MLKPEIGSRKYSIDMQGEKLAACNVSIRIMEIISYLVLIIQSDDGRAITNANKLKLHLSSVLQPSSVELRIQKLKFHLLRTQSLKVLPLKPGIGQYIAGHACSAYCQVFLPG